MMHPDSVIMASREANISPKEKSDLMFQLLTFADKDYRIEASKS